MARFVALLFLAAIICSTYALPKMPSPTDCGENEVFKSCGFACEGTCQNPNPVPCVHMCYIGCECQKGFLRSHPGGKCIPQPQCLLRE